MSQGNAISTTIDWFYEDVVLDEPLMSQGRTITESDSNFFCMLTGDWNPLHCDEQAAKASRFGRRVVAGFLGMSLINAALHQWGVFANSGLAMLGIRDWKFVRPIYFGDTLKVEMRVTGKRKTSRGDAGILMREFTIRNQDGEVVQSGYSDMLIALRPA